jgi:aminoglycoside phosphotransferase (APT) family kinase protein
VGNLAWCDGTAALLGDLRRRRPDPVPETLIHGDLSLDNVLVEEGGRHVSISGFVDWPFGGGGDPRSDIAIALQTEPEIALGERDLAAFREGYGSSLPDADTRRWFVDLYEFF